jgi:hypothetical protein
MLQLNTWTHPKTGQIRVYVNGAPFQSGAKLFVYPFVPYLASCG